MIAFLVTVTQFFITLTVATMFLCMFLMFLALLDYSLDLDIKTSLNNLIGPRPFLKQLRERIIDLINRFDTPTWKDRLDTMPPTEPKDPEEDLKDLQRYLDGSNRDSNDR